MFDSDTRKSMFTCMAVGVLIIAVIALVSGLLGNAGGKLKGSTFYCPFCESENIKVVHERYETRPNYISENHSYSTSSHKVVYCLNCGQKFDYQIVGIKLADGTKYERPASYNWLEMIFGE